MADNVKKTSELPTSNGAVATDRVLILKDPSGSPSTRTITVANLLGNSSANVSLRSSTPANSTVTVTKGVIFFDDNFIYVAIANNTLKRVSLSSF